MFKFIDDMSIFRKILLTPLVGFLIFAIFLVYQQIIIKNNTQNIVIIKDDIYPILSLSKDNIILLEQIQKVYEDILVTGEIDWLDTIEDIQSTIIKNLYEIDPLKSKSVETLLNNYINSTSVFIEIYIEDYAYTVQVTELLEKSVKNLELIKNSLSGIHNREYNRFIHTLQKTNSDLENSLLFGILSFIGSFIFILIVIFITAKKVSTSIIFISNSFDAMLKSQIGFNAKLDYPQKDELGKLATGFNKIIELVNDKHDDLKLIHKNIRDSIKFASLIQGALLPDDKVLETYVEEYFTFWQPRDTVGGDIYFVTELDSGSEILIMVIDGAGHGVPGSFVTMLVKAIETQIVGEIKIGTLEPSPAKVLSYFNRTIKTMLKQEKGSKSNAGFDGGVLYFNKDTNICKYAGAKTPLYIIQDGELEIVKSDRKNVGFIRTKMEQKYTEYDIEIKDGTQLYLCTDGIIDQEGENDSRYGKTKFEKLILKHHEKSISEQEKIIQNDFESFKSTFEQSDDVTVVGLKF